MGTVELMALCLEDVFEGPQVSVPPHVLTKKAIANSESITAFSNFTLGREQVREKGGKSRSLTRGFAPSPAPWCRA